MPKYIFQLYVTGQTPRSLRAEFNLRHLCERHLGADHQITLIDVQVQPDVAETANIFATPATIRIAPLPSIKVIGDLSDLAKVMAAFGIEPVEADPSKEGSL